MRERIPNRGNRGFWPDGATEKASDPGKIPGHLLTELSDPDSGHRLQI